MAAYRYSQAKSLPCRSDNPMKKKNGKQLLSFCIPIFLMLLIDQGSKLLAEAYLKEKNPIRLIPGVFELYYLENTGAAFGILKHRQPFLILLAVVITGFTGWVCIRLLPPQRKYAPLRFVCCMLSAGALGNMIDRIRHQYVIDFLYFSLIDFPVFNVADIFVCVSCALLLILLLFYYKEEDLQFAKR